MAVVCAIVAAHAAERGGGGRGQADRPVRDVPSTAGAGVISGRVVIDGGGTPVRRARIVLSGPELTGARSTLSDDRGAFAFEDLPAGRFTLSASKAGFVDGTYGARRAGRPGTPIHLADGQHLERLIISLAPGGAITGTVVDEFGDPAPGTPVRALRAVMRTGTKTLELAGQDRADDRGVYRIHQLPPGEYIVNAVPRNANVADVRQPPIDPTVQQVFAELGQTASLTAYAPVYYPGTTILSGATTLAIGSAEERTNIDFHLQLVPTAMVEGIIARSDGAPLPPGAQLVLVPTDTTSVVGLGVTMTRPEADGHFTFRGVTPGQYSIQARAPVFQEGPGAVISGREGGVVFPPLRARIVQVLWAAADVFVNGQNVTGIGLSLQPGLTISGRLEFRGTSDPPGDMSQVHLSLLPRGDDTFDVGRPPPADVDESGRFTIAGVSPGRYSFAATIENRKTRDGTGQVRGAGAASGATRGSAWALASAVVNGQDVLDFPIDIRPGAEPDGLTLMFTDRRQEISGTVRDRSGQPVSDFTIIVFPSDPRFWLPESRRIASVRTGTDGAFAVRGLPPGDYRMAAVTDVQPGEWYDPAFLTRLQSAAIAVALREGESTIQHVKLAGP